jgi:hypothetical protein
MGGLFKVGIPAAAIAVLMGVTNPKPESYNSYVSQRMISKGENVVCEQLGACEKGKTPVLIKNVAMTTMKPLIASATKRQNLLLLSLYTTEVPGIGTMKSIGAFGNFFTYSET